MTRGGFWVLFSALALGVIALSTGSAVFLYAAVLLLLLLAGAAVSVRLAARTLRVSASLAPKRVHRGEEAVLRVELRHRGFLPVAPLQVTLTDGETERAWTPEGELFSLSFRPKHVGVIHPGIRAVTIGDLFGLWQRRVTPPDAEDSLLCLPLLFDTEPLTFSPGDPGAEAVARATEDTSDPSDIRAYQSGDPLKKVHWKLSARKGELLVRRFEDPTLQEALVLLDCTPPPDWGHPEAAADVRDTLVETAASVMTAPREAGVRLYLPLNGSHPIELTAGMGDDVLCEHLAREGFDRAERFEEVLLLETRRLRSVGCTVVITARLNGAMVELMRRMRQMGPHLRLYLITFSPDDPHLRPMIARLQQAEVEVCYVQPGKQEVRE